MAVPTTDTHQPVTGGSGVLREYTETVPLMNQHIAAAATDIQRSFLHIGARLLGRHPAGPGGGQGCHDFLDRPAVGWWQSQVLRQHFPVL